MLTFDRKTRILCLGDSNTYGYDPRSYLGSRYPATVRWTGLLQSGAREIVNCGQNGLSVPREGETGTYLQLVRSKRPLDLVTVMLGSNDLLQGASAAQTAERMRAFLTALRDAAAGERLLLIAPPPMQTGDWVQSAALIAESKALAELYRSLAGELDEDFADARAWGVALSFDGVHFTPEGHAAFASGLENTLKELGLSE